MAIKVVGKRDPAKYRINCTDASCRAVIEFDHDDVKHNSRYSMGREVDTVEGIVCPECNQVLALKDATKITES